MLMEEYVTYVFNYSNVCTYVRTYVHLRVRVCVCAVWRLRVRVVRALVPYASVTNVCVCVCVCFQINCRLLFSLFYPPFCLPSVSAYPALSSFPLLALIHASFNSCSSFDFPIGRTSYRSFHLLCKLRPFSSDTLPIAATIMP